MAAISLGIVACGDDDSGDKCSYTAAKCNADGSALLMCVNGREVEKKCACKDGKCEDAAYKCDFTTPKCSDDGQKLLTCTAGQLTEKACKCKDGKCEDAAGKCDFTTPKCSDDGQKLLTCTAGQLTEKACKCKDGKCEDVVDKCDFTTPKCSDDKQSLLTCVNGQIQPKSCNCEDGECVDPDAKCDYTGDRCSQDGTMLVSCDGKKITGTKECTCVDNECEECDYDGKRCDSTSKNVVKCDKKSGQEVFVKQCPGACDNGSCMAVECPSVGAKSCLDMKTRYYCDATTNVMVESQCEAGLICVDGDCVEREGEEQCNFEKHCIDDKRGIQDCKNGKVEFTPCNDGEYCTTEGGIRCIKAETCDNFTPYCVTNEDGSQYAMMCNDTSDKPYKKGCKASCQNGECTVSLTFGHTCNNSEEGNWRDTCIGNKVATCIKRSNGSFEVVEPNKSKCEEKGEICGIEKVDGLEEYRDPRCYEPCDLYGQVINSCVPNGDHTATIQYKCEFIDHTIGDKRMGFVEVPHSLQDCDIDCKNGQCINYTTGIEDAGKECKKDEFQSRCHDADRAVTCDEMTDDDGNTKGVVRVDKCNVDEACVVIGGQASCNDSCKQGDPDIYKCDIFLNNSVSLKYSCQKTDKDVYAYQYASENVGEYMTTCAKGCNEKTGRCN